MIMTAQQHRDAASRLQTHLQAQPGHPSIKRNAALQAVASAHGTDWATLKQRPTLPMLGQSRRGDAVSAQLEKQGVTVTPDEAAALVFKSYPVPEVFPIYLALHHDYTYVVRGQEITCGFYEEDTRLSDVLTILESLHGPDRVCVVDVVDLILQEHARENPDDLEGDTLDNEWALLLSALERDAGVLERLQGEQEQPALE